MTLREIFNSILDHNIEFELDPWALLIGVAFSVGVLLLLNLWFWYSGRDV